MTAPVAETIVTGIAASDSMTLVGGGKIVAEALAKLLAAWMGTAGPALRPVAINKVRRFNIGRRESMSIMVGARWC
jgi:hypothetical protein